MVELLSDFKAFVIKVKRKTVTLSVRYTSGLFDTLSLLPGRTLQKSQDEVIVERLGSWYQMKSKKSKEIR
jgi:hypothetical protein